MSKNKKQSTSKFSLKLDDIVDGIDTPTASKFTLNYDDSSSEEDERDVHEHYTSQRLKDGKASTHKVLREAISLYSAPTPDLKQAIDTSLTLHEIGINLVKSPEVGQKYFSIKRKFLSENKVPSKVVLDDTVNEALEEVAQSQGLSIAPQQKREFVKYLTKDSRKLIKTLESDESTYLYPYTNPLKLSNKKVNVTKQELTATLDSIYAAIEAKPLVAEDNIVRKSKNKASYKALHHDSIWSYKPEGGLQRFLKSKILEQTVKITKKQFIDEVFGSQELQNAMDTGQVEFVTNLRFTIKLKIQEINKEHTVRATLDRHFTHKLDAEDMPIELVALSRLMTTSLKRSNKNILEHPSVLGSKKSEHTRKISFADAEVMEVQLLQQSGSRSDQVVMDTIGPGSSYLNIALTIEVIKANIKGVSEKKIVGWIKQCLHGKEMSLPPSVTSKQAISELKEFISALTYLLFGTEAARNPACFVVHPIMLELIEKGKLTFLSAFTHLEHKTTGQYEEYDVQLAMKATSNGLIHASGGLMPMSQERAAVGAVEVARLMNEMFSTSLHYTYDKGAVNAIFSSQQEAYDLFVRIVTFEAKIVDLCCTSWLIPPERILEELILVCEKWYGITVMKYAIADDILYALDLDREDIASLSVKNLITLNTMLSSFDDESKLKNAIKLGVNIKRIAELQESDSTELGNAIDVIEAKPSAEQDLDFEQVVQVFQCGMDVSQFWELYTEYEKEDHDRSKFWDIFTLSPRTVTKYGGYEKIIDA